MPSRHNRVIDRSILNTLRILLLACRPRQPAQPAPPAASLPDDPNAILKEMVEKQRAIREQRKREKDAKSKIALPAPLPVGRVGARPQPPSSSSAGSAQTVGRVDAQPQLPRPAAVASPPQPVVPVSVPVAPKHKEVQIEFPELFP
jgi:hypothetical protein